MNAVLTAKGLSAGHADRAIFSGVDLVVPPGTVIGLVGANGAGKSTLLRMLAGLDEGAREAGAVSLSPPTAAVGYLPQEPERRPGESVLAFIERRTGVAAAAADLDAATAALESGQPGSDDAYADAFDRWMNLGGADLEERTAKVAASLGLAAGLGAPMAALSGGQAARANLASLLLSRYDVFLLDEPTNDLDIAGLATLEDFVVKLRAPAVLVSHDRAFLERTVDQVLELDLAQQSARLYSGGYLAYLDERAIAQQHARDSYDKYADRKAALTDRMRMQASWVDKGVRQARAKAPDKDKNRLSAQVNRTEKLAGKVQATERMLERLEAVDEPRKEWELRMTIAAAPRSGTIAVALRDAVVSLPGFTLGPVSLQVNWADRVAITGPNGAGKSTLIAALLGRAPLASGSASLGSGIQVGEVDQARSLFDGPAPLLAAFAAQVPDQVPEETRTLLAKFGLKAAHVLRPAASLSPGERTRAALALLQARGVNLLVLDEPTNHLDLPAIEQLESALDGYPGTFLLVTHDRRMLESVAVTRRLVVSGGQVTEADVA
ncbi:MAG TPA: ABC-F family ATP-binding cassette domain-containing protein [Trebonia sp.]|nr:ABC-F family ATP-binding cassette domain-containing protein [Trebonia sp.]